jgi:hypothetical protein
MAMTWASRPDWDETTQRPAQQHLSVPLASPRPRRLAYASKHCVISALHQAILLPHTSLTVSRFKMVPTLSCPGFGRLSVYSPQQAR